MDTAAAAAAHTPVIRRFSGGGAVVVDGGTLTVGLAGCAATLPAGTPLGPRDIMAWTGEIYGPVFGEWGQFALRENGELHEGGVRSGQSLGPSERRPGSSLKHPPSPLPDYVFGDFKFGGNAQAISKGRWVHHTCAGAGGGCGGLGWAAAPTRGVPILFRCQQAPAHLNPRHPKPPPKLVPVGL